MKTGSKRLIDNYLKTFRRINDKKLKTDVEEAEEEEEEEEEKVDMDMLFEQKTKDNRPKRPRNILVTGADKELIYNSFKGVAEVYYRDQKIWVKSTDNNRNGLSYTKKLRGCS